MQQLRHRLRERIHDVHRLSDDEVLQHFGRLVAAGRIAVLPPAASVKRSTAAGGAGVMQAPKEPAAAPPAARQTVPRKYWIEFRVVDDETGASIEGVELMVKLGDGSVTTVTTDAGGYVEFNDCAPGTCELTCDFSSVQLSRSYAFVRVV